MAGPFPAAIETDDKYDSYQSELEKSCRELAKGWSSFQKTVLGRCDSKLDTAPPSFRDVSTAVDSAIKYYENKCKNSKTGKVTAGVSRFCNGLHDYEAIFKCLPENDKYVSLVAGSLSAIVKASVNHEDIMEKISDTFSELSEDISIWKRQLEVHRDNQHMKKIAAQFYTNVFQFFLDIMNGWMKTPSWKRTFKSFNEGFLQKCIQSKRDKLEILKERFALEGALESEKVVSSLPENVEAIKQEMEQLRAMMQIITCEQERFHVGREAQTMLHTIAQTRMISGSGDTTDLVKRQASPHLRKMQTRMGNFQRDSIKRSINDLTLRDTEERWHFLVESCYDLQLQISVFQKIQQWTYKPSSSSLWICGDYGVPPPSRTSLTGAYVSLVAERIGVPTVTYTCPSRIVLGRGVENMESAVVELLVSVIFQLVNMLPDEFSTELDFSETRCRSLEASFVSIADLISFMEDLIVLCPEVFICVINGLENISVSETEPAIRDLVEVISRPTPQYVAGGTKTIKTLFTTNGYCESLTQLGWDEIFRNNELDS